MALARKIAYNVVVNTIAKVLSTVLALVNIGFITRYLGVNGFGDYELCLRFFLFSELFSIWVYILFQLEKYPEITQMRKK